MKIPEINKNQLITIGIVTVLLIVSVIIIAVKWNNLKDWVKQRKESKLLDKEIVSSDVTISDSQITTYANKLHEAMKGAGTNEKAIRAVFEAINSKSDLLSICKKFRELYGENLADWLNDDLSQSDINKINQILSEKGIDYSF